jgi:hypothetical protein
VRPDAVLLVDHAKAHAGVALVEVGESLTHRGTVRLDDRPNRPCRSAADWQCGS